MTTAPAISMHTPDRNAGALSGHGFMLPVKALATASCRCGVGYCHQTPAVRPETRPRDSAELTGLAGKRSRADDPVCRGAEGGHSHGTKKEQTGMGVSSVAGAASLQYGYLHSLGYHLHFT